MKKKYIIEDISIDKIDLDEQLIRDQPTDDEIGELAESIAFADLLEFPGVIRGENGRYKLAWGRRRLEAIKRLGETEVPCRIYEGSIQEVKLLALIENNQRKQNSIKEECDCVNYLHEARDLSADQIASTLGRTRSWVLTRLAIPNFPPDCREAILAGAIPLGHAEEIASVEDDGQRAYILTQTTFQRLPLNEVKQLVRIAKQIPDMSKHVEAGVAAAHEQAMHQPVMMPCAKCGQPALLSQLSIVRVHTHDCLAEATYIGEDTSHAHPGA